nr:hypothetical protein [Rhizobium sp. 42MFCr.1]
MAPPVRWATSLNAAEPGGSGVLGPSENDRRQRRDWVTYGANAEPVTEEVVEGKPQLLARLHQTKHDIARNTTILAHRAAGDLPLRDKRS